MRKPILVLQYPDSTRTVALAATKDEKVMRAFKDAVLEEARLNAIGFEDDPILETQNKAELERLEAVLGVLIP